MEKEEPIIVFHHVPKSGGSYVLTAVCGALKAAGRLKGSIRVAFGQEAPEWAKVVRAVNVVSSHWCYHPRVFARPENVFYMTWTRDPVELFFSAFEYYRSPLAGLPWKEDPVMLRQIGQLFKARNFEEYVEWCEAGEGEGWVAPYPVGHVLTEAERGRFDFVGRCEWMEDDLTDLCARLGVGVRFPMRDQRNAGPGRLDREVWRPRVRALLERYMEAQKETQA